MHCNNICGVKKCGNSPRINYLQLTSSGLHIEWLLALDMCVYRCKIYIKSPCIAVFGLFMLC